MAHSLLDALGPEAASGPPRLVRLYPANPWKTRGNAAVVLQLRDELEAGEVLDTAFAHVEQVARLADDKGAGLALFQEPPPETWYWRGVQGQVPMAEALEALDELDVRTRTLGTGRGLVGCLCAAAWRPGAQATWERIAYRKQPAWGTPRQVDPWSLVAVGRRFTGTFDCVDPRDGHPAMVPRTPCPVLYGLRATDPERLEQACSTIESESVAGARTYLTNQATDDHVREEVLVPLEVTARPEALAGGHVRLEGTTIDGEQRICMAFEPTGPLRQAVLACRRGDTVLPVGGLRTTPEGRMQVNLEKFLHRPAPRRRRQVCAACGGAMGSLGRSAGRRCSSCGHRVPDRYDQGEPSWHEARVSARRHLARPLSLGLAPRIERAARVVLDPHDSPEPRGGAPAPPRENHRTFMSDRRLL